MNVIQNFRKRDIVISKLCMQNSELPEEETTLKDFESNIARQANNNRVPLVHHMCVINQGVRNGY